MKLVPSSLGVVAVCTHLVFQSVFIQFWSTFFLGFRILSVPLFSLLFGCGVLPVFPKRQNEAWKKDKKKRSDVVHEIESSASTQKKEAARDFELSARVVGGRFLFS